MYLEIVRTSNFKLVFYDHFIQTRILYPSTVNYIYETYEIEYNNQLCGQIKWKLDVKFIDKKCIFCFFILEKEKTERKEVAFRCNLSIKFTFSFSSINVNLLTWSVFIGHIYICLLFRAFGLTTASASTNHSSFWL